MYVHALTCRIVSYFIIRPEHFLKAYVHDLSCHPRGFSWFMYFVGKWKLERLLTVNGSGRVYFLVATSSLYMVLLMYSYRVLDRKNKQSLKWDCIKNAKSKTTRRWWHESISALVSPVKVTFYTALVTNVSNGLFSEFIPSLSNNKWVGLTSKVELGLRWSYVQTANANIISFEFG